MIKQILLFILFINYSLCVFRSLLKKNTARFENSLRRLENTNTKCFFVQNKNVYSFSGLERKKDYVYEIGEGNGKLLYNFCTDVKTKCKQSVEEEEVAANSTLIYVDSENICKRLTGTVEGNDGVNNWKEFSDTITMETGEKTVKPGVTLSLAKGDKCTEDKNYKITYKFYCNGKRKDGDFTLDFSEFNPSKCEQTFTGEAVEACQINGILRLQGFYERYKVIIGLVIVLIGIFFVTFGTKIFRVTVVIVCGIALTIVVSLIVFSNFAITSTKGFWLTILIPFVIGIAIGCVLLKALKIAFFVIGATCGYAVGVFVYNFALKYIHWNPTVLYWLILILCMIIFGFLGILFYKLMLIVSTSIIGGYLIIKAFSLWCGHFPDENEVIQLIKNQEYDALKGLLTWHVYLYLTFWVIISIAGIAIQCHFTRSMDKKSFTNEPEKKKDEKEEKFN